MSAVHALAAAHSTETPTAIGLSRQTGFNLVHDNRNNELFFYYSPGDHTDNYSDAVDVASFNREHMQVQKRVTSIFDTDLTSRDNVLVAFLSLFLVLIIGDIVTTLHLCMARTQISRSGFTTKQFVANVTNFRIFNAIQDNGDLIRLDCALRILAISILFSAFLLELGVLLLTYQRVRHVSNSDAAFHLLQPITPDWQSVRFQARISINRPCIAVTLFPVDAQRTSISTCMVSNITDGEFLFRKQRGKPKLVRHHYITRLHKYGADHEVTIGDVTANFSARAYLQLHDGQERLMSVPHNQQSYKHGQVHLIHKMYIGFLVSSYVKATKDKRITEKLMRSLQFHTAKSAPDQGGDVSIINKRQSNDILKVPSTRFETIGTAPDVGTSVSLAYGQALFKGCIGVQVGDGKIRDLITSKGEESELESYMWEENRRMLNWLSLVILLPLATTLRWKFQQIIQDAENQHES